MSSISLPLKYHREISSSDRVASVETSDSKTSGLWSSFVNSAWNIASGIKCAARALCRFKNGAKKQIPPPAALAPRASSPARLSTSESDPLPSSRNDKASVKPPLATDDDEKYFSDEEDAFYCVEAFEENEKFFDAAELLADSFDSKAPLSADECLPSFKLQPPLAADAEELPEESCSLTSSSSLVAEIDSSSKSDEGSVSISASEGSGKISRSAKRRQREKLRKIGSLTVAKLPASTAPAAPAAVPLNIAIHYDSRFVTLSGEMMQNLRNERGESHFVALDHVNEAIKKILNVYKRVPDDKRHDLAKIFRINGSDRYLCMVAHKYPHSNPAIITSYYMDTSSARRKLNLDGSSNEIRWEMCQKNLPQITGAVPAESYVWQD